MPAPAPAVPGVTDEATGVTDEATGVTDETTGVAIEPPGLAYAYEVICNPFGVSTNSTCPST